MKISADFASRAYKQEYSKKLTIEDVQIIGLKRFNDDGGAFTELACLAGGVLQNGINIAIAQINYSEMAAGAIKAFHFHQQQTDIWFVPPGDKILLILVDLREDSPTCGVQQRLILGDCQSQLIIIPPGVAHGCKNIAAHEGHIIYFMDQQFNPDPMVCDEWRLPWDYFGAEIWDIHKG